MSTGNARGCYSCQINEKTLMEGDVHASEVKMNNNPIRMLFNMGATAIDALSEYSRRGLLVKEEEKIDTRMQICSECKVFDKEFARCKICGCFMKLKIRLEISSCPIGKW